MSRDSVDAWVEGPGGIRRWGVYGAAGVLVVDPARGVLLQHRAEWSHFGGTWALPGGARHRGESAIDGALREAAEEASVPRDAVRLRSAIVVDLGFWSYTTVIVDVVEPFEAVVADPESIELRWVPVDEVEALPLHPSFGEAWPRLRALLAEKRMTLVVDAANVVGSRPDGWWKDRAGAARRLVERVRDASARGFDVEGDGVLRWADVVVVLEGQAAGAVGVGDADDADDVEETDEVEGSDVGAPETLWPRVLVRDAERDGDQEIVEVVETLAEASTVRVVTADRELISRVTALGAEALRPGWFQGALDEE